MFQVEDARREKQKALIGLIGPSGSGKSLSGLLLAKGIVKEMYPDATDAELWSKIGCADTEHKRLLNYVGQEWYGEKIGSFKYINFTPPYNKDRYAAAIHALKQQGVEVILIDSLSHQWQGEGGVVETHGQMSGNSFQNWGKLSTESTGIVKVLTSQNVHVITTLRVKANYVIENVDGKSVPRKIGTTPIQKDDMEYEFDTIFSIDMDHNARINKDITNLFEGEFAITPEIGSKLYRYLELGVDVLAEEKAKREAEELERITLINDVITICTGNDDKMKILAECEFKGKIKLKEMTIAQINRVIELLGK